MLFLGIKTSARRIEPTRPKKWYDTISPIEHAHAAPCHAQGARGRGIHVPLRGDEYGSSGYPRAYEDEHVHENGRGRASGYAHGNEQDLHACAYEYAYGNADVNDNVRADEFLPYVNLLKLHLFHCI